MCRLTVHDIIHEFEADANVCRCQRQSQAGVAISLDLCCVVSPELYAGD